MSKLIASLFGCLYAASLAFAQVPTPGRLAASYCAPKAVDKDGNPLAGAARASFMKKCEADSNAVATECASKAIDRNGKALAGAAKASFVRKCESDAKAGK
jgi:hypothetical protein